VKSLAGLRALVTGGTAGIGASVANELRLSGAEVVICGRSLASHDFGRVDFADPNSLEQFIGRLSNFEFDILINNAGINKIAPFLQVDSADFSMIHQVNVVAPFRLIKTVLPGMVARQWGRIVNVSSIFGVISKEQRAAYSASKFALSGLTKALALEVAKQGVLANCVCPGFTETKLTQDVLGETGMQDMARKIPIGRLCQPQEIASLVRWLVGHENTYLTGQDIVIDGGFTIE
jgi:3-oxoacyl-[acyl-carrier protein] reductase